MNDKDLALVKKINKGDVEDGEVLTFAGGGGWGNAATGVLLCNQDAWTAVDEEITGEPVLEGEPKAYSSGSVTLKPEGGFQVGNMYEASALIQSVPATGSLNIVIENIQSGGEINFSLTELPKDYCSLGYAETALFPQPRRQGCFGIALEF